MTLKYLNEVTEDDDSYGNYLDWLNKVGDSIGIVETNWAAYDHNLDFHEVAFPATVKRIYHPWVSDCYVSLKHNATWLDVWKQCEKLIIKSGDLSHYFIEDFTIRSDGKAVTFFAGS